VPDLSPVVEDCSLIKRAGVMVVVLAASAAALQAMARAPLAAVEIRASADNNRAAYDGVVEAVRETVLAAKVSGAVVSIDVKAGDAVERGQLLLQIDPREAEQLAAASAAQVQAGNALLDAATREYQRQRQLFEKQFIGQSALDQAEAQYKSTRADAHARIAAASASRAQSGFYSITAPYDGIVSDVTAMPGDMALPGRTLLSLYDGGDMRVTASIPQDEIAHLANAAPASIRIELPGLAESSRWLTPSRVQFLPRVDPATHTVELRLALAPSTGALTPGLFARVWLPTAQHNGSPATGRFFVPASTIVRRAAMTAVYVLDDSGKPQLRQVRLGHPMGDNVEILSGVSAGEKVALDADAAAALP
jgi:membrane fusion protein, multidrug efflux system